MAHFRYRIDTFNILDATNSFDQARFFQENAEQVFQVVYDTCIHQIEKIKRKDIKLEFTQKT